MPGLHCPRPDRLGDSRQALPAVWHRGELARLVSQVPVTHYEKLRRHANDFHLVSMHRAPEPSTWQCIEFGNIALQLGSWLKTIWQTVWRWRLRFRHPLLYCFWSWLEHRTWSFLFLARRRWDQSFIPWPWVTSLAGWRQGSWGRSMGGLWRSCVSAIDFGLSFMLIGICTNAACYAN
jgi:hypothetical protein